MNRLSNLSDFLILRAVLVLLELSDLISNLIDSLLEFLHISDHLIQVLVLEHLQYVELFLNLGGSLLGRSEYLPLLVEVGVIGELVVELVEDLVDSQSFLNILLEFLDFIGDTCHVVLQGSQLLNVLRVRLNFNCDFLKVSQQFIACHLGSLRDQIDLILGNLEMLFDELISDFLAADSKHRDDNLIRYFSLKSLSLLLMEDNILSKKIDFRRVLIIIELLNDGNRVNLVLLVILGVCLDVLIEWLHGLIELVCQCVVQVVDPRILIGESSLVLGVWVLRLVEGAHCRLQVGLHVRLEQVGKQLLLWGWDVLQVVYSLVKDCLNYLTDLSRGAAVSWLIGR
jgi:hypothetical protein